MDARGYCTFLNSRLTKYLEPLENNILSLVSQDNDKSMLNLYRNAGARDVLKQVIDSLEPWLNEYHKDPSGNSL